MSDNQVEDGMGFAGLLPSHDEAADATIVSNPSVEIIPAVNLSGLEQALSALANETARLEPIRLFATTLVVNDAATCQTAKLTQAEIRGIKKAANVQLERFWNMVDTARTFLSAKYNEHEGAADVIDKILAAKVKSYSDEETRRAKETEERENRERLQKAEQQAKYDREIREQQAKEEREKKVKEIKAAQKKGEIGAREAARMLKEAGAAEEAAKTEAEESAKAAVQAVKDNPLTVQANIPKVAGVPSTKHYKVEVTNFDALLSAFVDAITSKDKRNLGRAAYLRRFIMANEQAMGAEARLVKNSKLLNTTIPGIRAYED